MAITGPIPPFQNLPIMPQYFAPWAFVISGITLGVTTTVTMIIPSTTTLNYVVGQLVRLLIPASFGCTQLNEQTAYVLTVTAPNQVTLALNSVGGNPYISSSATTPAQIVAVGDINSGAINNNGGQNFGTYIPGSNINVSPN